MCGRYTLIADLGDLAQRFEFDGSDFSYDPGYNIAPTESVLTVRNVEGREAALMRWGLVPFWAKDPKIGARMINARAETVAEKPAFRNALKKTALPGPRRRLLRMAEDSGGEEAVQDNPEVRGALRHGRALGDVERPPGKRRAVLHHQRQPTTFLLPSTTGCQSSCPGSMRTYGWTWTLTTEQPLHKCLSPAPMTS